MAVAKGGSEKMARLSTFQRDNGIFVRIKGIKGESARSTKGYTAYTQLSRRFKFLSGGLPSARDQQNFIQRCK